MSCLSLKELQLSVNILLSTTQKLQLLYSQSAIKSSVNEFLEMVSILPFGICKRFDIFLAFTQKQIPGASPPVVLVNFVCVICNFKANCKAV